MVAIAKFRAGRFLFPLILTILAVFPPAGSSTDPPLGTVITADRVVIGSVSAPTGTTIFSGDRIKVENSPALLRFMSGSRVEMICAGASFKREEEWLVIEPEFGLLRFNFMEKENVRIVAGSHVFISPSQPAPRLGSLVLNHNGQIALGVERGEFEARTAGGGRRSVTAKAPLVVLEQSGLGRIEKGSDQLVDNSKAWRIDELEGMSVRMDGESHAIASNSENTVYIDGAWRHDNGSYQYEIGVSGRILRIPIVIPTIGAQAQSLGLLPSTIHAIVPNATYVAGVGIGFKLEEKTESSR